MRTLLHRLEAMIPAVKWSIRVCVWAGEGLNRPRQAWKTSKRMQGNSARPDRTDSTAPPLHPETDAYLSRPPALSLSAPLTSPPRLLTVKSLRFAAKQGLWDQLLPKIGYPLDPTNGRKSKAGDLYQIP